MQHFNNAEDWFRVASKKKYVIKHVNDNCYEAYSLTDEKKGEFVGSSGWLI
jgi:hypothetical protein